MLTKWHSLSVGQDHAGRKPVDRILNRKLLDFIKRDLTLAPLVEGYAFNWRRGLEPLFALIYRAVHCINYLPR